jgi:hypothetical protein
MGPRTGLDDVEKRKFLTLPGLELRSLGLPARSQSLYRLRYPGFRVKRDKKYYRRRKRDGKKRNKGKFLIYFISNQKLHFYKLICSLKSCDAL